MVLKQCGQVSCIILPSLFTSGKLIRYIKVIDSCAKNI